MRIDQHLSALAMASLALVGCSKGPDIQGEWYFDYAQTKLAEFPNPYYESARDLIADMEPRYGKIHVDGNTVVLGGAVCKINQINDKEGLECTERGVTSKLSLFYKDQQLSIQSQTTLDHPLLFRKDRQNPYLVYGIDLNAGAEEHQTIKTSGIAVPKPDSGSTSLKGLARTQNFEAFYDLGSIKRDGRYSSATMILNYLEPRTDHSSSESALSSAQSLTFDCPASNYRLDRYIMYKDADAKGEITSDSGELSKDDWKPVPENSVNKLLYTNVCRN